MISIPNLVHFGVISLPGLSASISPDKLQTVEGFVAAATCIAQGNLAGEIKWSRDYEPLDDKAVLNYIAI